MVRGFIKALIRVRAIFPPDGDAVAAPVVQDKPALFSIQMQVNAILVHGEHLIRMTALSRVDAGDLAYSKKLGSALPVNYCLLENSASVIKLRVCESDPRKRNAAIADVLDIHPFSKKLGVLSNAIAPGVLPKRVRFRPDNFESAVRIHYVDLSMATAAASVAANFR